ncbi:MAG: type II secretion system protein [Nitrospirae bacterium]|nr:type II secretion system protein [Nitrospirota bacterium]
MQGGNRGVTFLELIATMAIILILVSVAMPLSKVTAKRAKEIELRQDLREMRMAIDRFHDDWNRDGDLLIGPVCQANQLSCKEVGSVNGYPKTLDTLLRVDLSGEAATIKGVTVKRYLRRLPIDPITGEDKWGLRCYADDADEHTWCGDDVYDVHSISEKKALDGTTYLEW